MTEPQASELDSISAAEITLALNATLADEAFAASPQMSALLTHVVQEQVAGRGDRLKAYSIATAALGKPADFDAQNDPFVRVLATRVRKALELVAAQRRDGVVIEMPAGGYRPRFRRVGRPAAVLPPASGGADRRFPKALWIAAVAALGLLLAAGGIALSPLLRQAVPAQESPAGEGDAPENFAMSLRRPLLIVLSSDRDSEALAGRLRFMLARFDDLLAVSRENRPASFDRALAYELDVRRDGERLRLSLVRLPDGLIIWSRDLASVEPDETQSAQIATEIAQPYGVLFADLRRGPGAAATGEVGCGVIAMDYWLTYRTDRFAAALACLRRLAGEAQAGSAVHANLAMLLVEGYRRRWLPDDRTTLDEALGQARRAIELAPASSRARQALAAVHFVRGEQTRGLAEARAAVELNPFDMDVLADLGARLIQSGETAEGLRHLERSMTGAPVAPPWRLFYLWLGERQQGRAEVARQHAALLTTDDFPLGLAARLVEARDTGDEAARSRLAARLRSIAPAFLADPVTGLARRGFVSDVAARLGGLIRAARPPQPQG